MARIPENLKQIAEQALENIREAIDLYLEPEVGVYGNQKFTRSF